MSYLPAKMVIHANHHGNYESENVGDTHLLVWRCSLKTMIHAPDSFAVIVSAL
jgi:hypothetical protein